MDHGAKLSVRSRTAGLTASRRTRLSFSVIFCHVVEYVENCSRRVQIENVRRVLRDWIFVELLEEFVGSTSGEFETEAHPARVDSID
jgi:hypothetical protein